VIENDAHFFTGEIYGGAYNGWLQPVQVLEQVQARAAMYLRQIKGYMRLLFVAERDQLPLNDRVFQEGEFVFANRYPLVEAGVIIQGIIIAQAAFIQ
jgi:hypothetical protein